MSSANGQRTKLTTTALTRIVDAALAEDIGSGDVSAAIFRPSERGTAQVIAKQTGILSGSAAAATVFKRLSRKAVIRFRKRDGERFESGNVLIEIRAPLSALLSGERVALNFLQRLSGVATLTRQYVDVLGETAQIGIFDTRKTTPLLRCLERQAVRNGGGRNHRFGLDTMAMLKNNHIDAAGGISSAVARLRAAGFFSRRPRLKLVIEARTIGEAGQAATAGADIVLLDNMPPSRVRAAVKEIHRRCGSDKPQIELSGGITLGKVRALRDLPIDRISIGALTHSAPAVDISMRIRPDKSAD